MRILLAALISAVVGTAVGGSLAYLQVSREETAPPPSIVSLPEPGDEMAPRAAVAESEYDFGEMERGTTRSHEFLFRNTGTAPLLLQSGITTCKCTLSQVPDAPIPPGGSGKVVLEWRSVVATGPYRQSAEIKTNDPNHSRVVLSVTGEVTETSGVSPADFVFGKIRYGEEKSADVYVMSNLDPVLEVSDPVFSDPSTSQYLAVDFEPVDRAQLPRPSAMAGVRVRITTRPGLPLGRFDQWLSLRTNMHDAERLEIPVTGRVMGSVTISGRNWNEDQGVLRLGTVNSSEGAKAELNILARDEVAAEMASEASFEVVSCDPPELKVSVGQPKRLSDQLVATPLMIEVPPGTPPMVRLETSQGDEGSIVLRSTLSNAPQLTIKVRFAVQR
jgi:hypothetical protein